ncbi:hypothetical protein V5298_19265, partial [Alteromonas sp. 14N.309.X.WAT.G.H12]
MDELRLSLLILGTCFIIAVLAHGIWKIRKANQTDKKQRIEPRDWEEQATDEEDESHDADYDDLGLGKVRVVSSAQPHAAPAPVSHSATDEHAAYESDNEDPLVSEDAEDEMVAPAQEPEPVKLYGSVVSNPKPHLQASRGTVDANHEPEDVPKPPEFLIKKADEVEKADETDAFSLDSPEVVTTAS